MSAQQKIREGIKRILVLNSLTIVILIVAVCSVMIGLVYYSQGRSERNSLPPIDTTSSIEHYQIAKLNAEIKQIRSDTSGSLFWLKMFALFVTVGGAVGGYLAGQSHVAQRRIEFENRKNIDSAYQSIVQELSDNSPLLRAAAAVKLGMILKSFPTEWTVSEARKEQLIQLTKQVLAASLSIEQDRKVLKTLTIAVALHKPWADDPTENVRQSPSILRSNVPFGFNVGDEALPAGDYTVEPINSTGDALLIIGQNSRRAKILLANSVKVAKPSKSAKLVFHRYAEHYFLSEVWTSETLEGRKSPKSKLEGKLARQPFESVEIVDQKRYGDVRELDLSGAKAADAYWARANFSGADFYRADLRNASFRESVLRATQFRDAELRAAVLVGADCTQASFKLADLSKADLSHADLRGADLYDADLTGATLIETKFDGASVYGCKLVGAKLGANLDARVNTSPEGQKPVMVNVQDWLKRETRRRVSSQ